MLWLVLTLSLAGGASIHSGIQVAPGVAALPLGHEQVVVDGTGGIPPLVQAADGTGGIPPLAAAA